MTDIDRPTRGFSPRAERLRLEFGAHRFRTVFLAGVAGIALMAAETDANANGGDNDLSALINRGAWDGDVLGNTGYVLNEDGTWTGDVAANSGQVSNTGTLTGDIVSNDSQIGNEGGIWNGDILVRPSGTCRILLRTAGGRACRA